MNKKHILILATMLGICVSSVAAQADILVSVARKSISLLTVRDLCDMIHYGANKVRMTEIECVAVDPNTFLDPNIKLARDSGYFPYHVQIREVSNGLQVTVQHWIRTDELEPKQSQFNIFRDREQRWVKFLEDLGSNIIYYDQNKDALKMDLLRGVIGDSRKIKVDEKGSFIDLITGKRVTGKQAYQIYKTEGDLQKNKMAYAIEITAIFAYYSYRYYQNHINQHDWDYPWLEGMYKKVTGDAIRFDDNDRPTNLGHVNAGHFFYLACRGNGFSAAESFFCAALSSAFWEIVVEFREVLSYNDLWTTIVAGSVQGEATFQAARSMRCGGTKLGRIFSAILNPFEEINYWTKGPVNLVCPNKQAENDLSIGYYTNGGKTFVPITLESEIFDFPVQDMGPVKLYIPGVFYSRLRFQWDVSDEGLSNLTQLSQIAFMAMYKQNLNKDASGKVSGYQAYISATSSYRRDEHRLWEGYEDGHFTGVVNILGPRVQLNGIYKGKEVRLVMEVYRNFALITNAALDGYIEEKGVADLPTVLEKHGYYYSFGWTSHVAIEGRAGKFVVGAETEMMRNDAIHGFDRYEEQLQEKIHMSDNVRADRFYVRFNATRRVAFEVVYENYDVDSRIEGGYKKRTSENRVTGKVKYRF